jgi:hypothetical protein
MDLQTGECLDHLFVVVLPHFMADQPLAVNGPEPANLAGVASRPACLG